MKKIGDAFVFFYSAWLIYIVIFNTLGSVVSELVMVLYILPTIILFGILYVKKYDFTVTRGDRVFLHTWDNARDIRDWYIFTVFRLPEYIYFI